MFKWTARLRMIIARREHDREMRRVMRDAHQRMHDIFRAVEAARRADNDQYR